MLESTMSWMLICSNLIFLFKMMMAEWFSRLVTRGYGSLEVMPTQMCLRSTVASSASDFCSISWMTCTTRSESLVPFR